MIGNKVTIQYSKINLDTSSEQEIDNTDINKNDILEKLSEINGNVQVINAKLDGRNIVWVKKDIEYPADLKLQH